MTNYGGHEGTIEQIVRLFRAATGDLHIDDSGRVRMDCDELDETVQQEIRERWFRVNTDTLTELADFPSYRADQLALFGFGVPGVDYAKDVDPTTISFL